MHAVDVANSLRCMAYYRDNQHSEVSLPEPTFTAYQGL